MPSPVGESSGIVSRQKRTVARSVTNYQVTAIGSGKSEDSRSELFTFNFGSTKKKKALLVADDPVPDPSATGEENEENRGVKVRKNREELPVVKANDKKGRSKQSTAKKGRDEVPVTRESDTLEQDLKNKNVRPKKRKTSEDHDAADVVVSSINGNPEEARRRSSRNTVKKCSGESGPIDNNEKEEKIVRRKRKIVPKVVDDKRESEDVSVKKRKEKANESRISSSQNTTRESGNKSSQPDPEVEAAVEPTNVQSVPAEDNSRTTFIIEEVRAKQYMKLQNSSLTQNRISVASSVTNNCISYIGPDEKTMTQEFPGVIHSRSPAFDDTVGVGFIKLKPKTIKPFEKITDAQSIYFIINGKVTVRSCGGFYTRGASAEELQRYLYPQELCAGQCFAVPPFTCFTVENWGSKEVLLGYNYVRVQNQGEVSNAAVQPVEKFEIF